MISIAYKNVQMFPVSQILYVYIEIIRIYQKLRCLQARWRRAISHSVTVAPICRYILEQRGFLRSSSRGTRFPFLTGKTANQCKITRKISRANVTAIAAMIFYFSDFLLTDQIEELKRLEIVPRSHSVLTVTITQFPL